MSKEFEFNCDIPYGQNRYVLMDKGHILEVSREDYSDCPFGHCCIGNYGYGNYSDEAYKDAWDKMSSKTTNAIEERVADFLFNNMKVEGGIVTEGFGVMNVPVDEREAQVATFPGIKGMEKMTLELDGSDYNDIVLDKDMDYLLELVQRDYYDPFCGSDGRFSPEKMLDFCTENKIDISDIVLLETVNLDRSSTAVIFIEAKEFEDHSGVELKNATKELKESMLKESVQMLEDWNDGNVYQWVLYDKHGDEIDSCGGYYGDAWIKDAVENFDGGNENLNPKKDLGLHRDIANCLHSNRKELGKGSRSNDER